MYGMARISASAARGLYRISIKGRLTAHDLQRLEHACGSTLEQREIPVELCLGGVAAIDQAARAYLDRLRGRGAVIVGHAAEQVCDPPDTGQQ